VVLGLAETITHERALSDEERVRLLGKVHTMVQEIVGLMNKFFELT
jgi:hypothetical protein